MIERNTIGYRLWTYTILAINIYNALYIPFKVTCLEDLKLSLKPHSYLSSLVQVAFDRDSSPAELAVNYTTDAFLIADVLVRFVVLIRVGGLAITDFREA